MTPGDRLLKGIGVSPGIAMGPTVTVRWALPEVPHRVVPRTQVEKEVRRLRAALKDVRGQLSELRARAEDRAGVDEARIFDAQLPMLEDKDFIGGVEELIRENHFTAEKAFEFKTLEVRDLWTAAGNPLLKERLADLTGVAIRVIQHLMHKRGSSDVWESLSEPSILVARELSPGLTVQLDRDHVVGLISEEGLPRRSRKPSERTRAGASCPCVSRKPSRSRPSRWTVSASPCVATWICLTRSPRRRRTAPKGSACCGRSS